MRNGQEKPEPMRVVPGGVISEDGAARLVERLLFDALQHADSYEHVLVEAVGLVDAKVRIVFENGQTFELAVREAI